MHSWKTWEEFTDFPFPSKNNCSLQPKSLADQEDFRHQLPPGPQTSILCIACIKDFASVDPSNLQHKWQESQESGDLQPHYRSYPQGTHSFWWDSFLQPVRVILVNLLPSFSLKYIVKPPSHYYIKFALKSLTKQQFKYLEISIESASEHALFINYSGSQLLLSFLQEPRLKGG